MGILDPPTLAWTVNGETVATVTGSVVTWHVAFTRENADALLRIAADYMHKSAADHATEVARLRGIADRAFDAREFARRLIAIADIVNPPPAAKEPPPPKRPIAPRPPVDSGE